MGIGFVLLCLKMNVATIGETVARGLEMLSMYEFSVVLNYFPCQSWGICFD